MTAVAGMLGPHDDVVVSRLDDGRSRYVVIGATTTGAEGVSGSVTDHPILGRLPSLDEQVMARTDDPRANQGLVEHLRAGGVRTIVHRPLGAVGSLLALRRGRGTDLPSQAEAVCDLATAVLAARAHRRELEVEHLRAESAAETARELAEAIRGLDGVATVDEVVGIVIRGIQRLDPELVGAVVGVVADGEVVRVSAVGTTPRSFVESLKGTRLEGFEIGRRIVQRHEPIFTGPQEVTLATRTKIMEPLGAQSLLAAGGFDEGAVRIVVSSYRSSPEPPSGWSLWSTASLLDHAAAVVGRIDRDQGPREDERSGTGEPPVTDLSERRQRRAH